MNEVLSEFRAHLIDVFIQYRNTDIKTMLDTLSEEIISSFQPELYLKNLAGDWRSEIRNLCNTLIESYESFNKGLIGDCYTSVYNLLFTQNTPSELGIETSLRPRTHLFRMRDSHQHYLFDKNEMVHIPYNLRTRISNQRYSISGFPCLYLGSSLYVCWEELNRPDFGNANSALFINNKRLKLMDLRFPKQIDSKSSLSQFLLAACTSIKRSDATDSFKPEYIIPQAILHSLVKYNYNNVSVEQYDGIIYTSSTFWTKDKLWDDENLFIDIVIPATFTSEHEVIKIKNNEYSTKVIDNFEVRGPISYNIYDYRQESYTGCALQECNVLYRDSQLCYNNNVDYDGYSYSKFHQLSSYLIANCK